MHTSIGKPLVALVSAACLSAPAAIPTLQHQLAPEESHVAVRLSAATTPFTPLTPGPVDAATVDAAVDSMATLTGIDKATLLLQLLTAPYHNALAIANATGTALQSAGMFVALPFSIATLVVANQTDQIPAYVQTVKTNLHNAIPGIRTAISTELAYDADLFAQLFGGNTGIASSAVASVPVGAVSGTPISRLTLLTQLLTAPYHNVLAVANATGSAIESFGMFLALPVSVATLVLANQTDQIPAYVSKVQSNLQNALPGIKTAIAKEVAYDKSLVAQVFGGSTTTAAATVLTSNALHAPNLLTGNSTPELSVAVPVETSTTEVSTTTATSPTHAATSDAAAASDVKKPTWAQKIADKVAENKAIRAEHSYQKESETAGSASEVNGTPSDTNSDASSDTTTKSSTRTAGKSSSTGSPAGGKHRKPDAA